MEETTGGVSWMNFQVVYADPQEEIPSQLPLVKAEHLCVKQSIMVLNSF